jgi:hypothetical protein
MHQKNSRSPLLQDLLIMRTDHSCEEHKLKAKEEALMANTLAHQVPNSIEIKSSEDDIDRIQKLKLLGNQLESLRERRMTKRKESIHSNDEKSRTETTIQNMDDIEDVDQEEGKTIVKSVIYDLMSSENHDTNF